VDRPVFESLPGVLEVIPVTHGYKLVSREVKPEDTVVEVGDVRIGGDDLVIAAGPCAVESLEQVLTVARAVRKGGARLLRGGAFKPRTSPYSFQGLGEEGLKILAAAREETGLGVVTEVVDPEGVDLVERYADVIQIGARNMQNFSLLKRCGKARKPVLLKRGLAATLEEFLMSAEYIAAEGNYEVILCERGVRTFSDFSRNTLDLAVVPAVKTRSHLPILVDPSHGTGRRDKVRAMSRGAIAVGADGLLVEVHHDPDTALSDGPQSITPEMFGELMGELRQIAPVIGRQL
jgi:3-deoxy-7-phosphoheptulonate synthase